MKLIVQRHAILLAAILQLLPLIRNFFINPATASAFAIVLRWGAGITAAVGTVDAVSGATNRFTSPSSFTGTVGVPFTNNLTLEVSKGDGGSLAVITSNSVSVVLSKAGQSTNFDMPPGLVLQFLDNINLASPVYDAIHGVPTTPGTNIFTISMEYGSSIVSADITIKILPGAGTLPGITNQPVSLTNLIGSSPIFSVTAGPPPLSYQWFFNTNTALPNATGASLALTNVQLPQAGYYRVVVSNSAGAVTSSPALLTVKLPPAPTITVTSAGATPGGVFQFTFNPAAGLTNTVQASSTLTGGLWETLTNIAPPATTNSITVADPLTSSNRFYRVRIIP